MFDKLKKAFSTAAKSISQKELDDKDIDRALTELQMALIESDVAQEVIDYLSVALKKDLIGVKLQKGQNPGEVVEACLRNYVSSMFIGTGKIDLIELIRQKKNAKKGPFVIVFLGINGTGKTTTVAKVANLLRKNNISVVLAAGDTHRAGAIEQLSEHANRVSVKVIAQRYGADPSAVGRDAVEYGRKHYIDAVLIDTAGRMQTAKNLMDEMSKIMRVVKPDLKLFIGDSLAGNDTINQAREFFQYAKFDGAILTKSDADSKGGAAISIVHITSKPIVYLGVGQGYDDIIEFNLDKFIESIFGPAKDVQIEDLVSFPEKYKKHENEIYQAKGHLEPESRIEIETPHQKQIDTITINDNLQKAESDNFPNDRAREISTSEPEHAQENLSLKDNDLNKSMEPNNAIDSNHKPASVISDELVQANQKELSGELKEEKKSRFGRLFGRKNKDKEKENQLSSNNQKPGQTDTTKNSDSEGKKGQREGNESDNNESGASNNDNNDSKEVIYLTDEDVEDLLK